MIIHNNKPSHTLLKIITPLLLIILFLCNQVQAKNLSHQKNKIPATQFKKNNNNTHEQHLLNPNYRASRALLNVGYDYKNYYSWRNLAYIGYAVLGSAVFANTRLDEEINRTYQKHLVNHATDKFARIVKHPGNNSSILIYLGGSLLGMTIDRWHAGNTFSVWSSRTLRGVIVGAPPVLLLQRVLGTGRPDTGSRWHPFKYDDEISGHAFLGSLPFITAAQMTDRMPLKILFYLGSTLTGWSRLNDNKHYFSQVIFGWAMGYLAASSVSRTGAEHRWHLTPYGWSDGTIGLQASITL